MTARRRAFRLNARVPALGGRRGDIVIVEPQHPTSPLILTRAFSHADVERLRAQRDHLSAILRALDEPVRVLRILVLALLVLVGGCGVFGPATEIMVINETDAVLDVQLGPCGQELEPFAVLQPGQSRTREVEPGCWHVTGWTDDGRFGEVEKYVSDGELAKFPFRNLDDI